MWVIALSAFSITPGWDLKSIKKNNNINICYLVWKIIDCKHKQTFSGLLVVVHFELSNFLKQWISFELWSWLASRSSLVMKLDFMSQLSSKFTLPLAGLQHMQQCQVGWNIPLSLFAPGFWSEQTMPEKWSTQWGVWTHDFSV
jgi:hypothetical protein